MMMAQRSKDGRVPKSAVLAFARQKISVPIYMLILFPFIFTVFAAVFSVSISAQTSFLGQLHSPATPSSNLSSMHTPIERVTTASNRVMSQNASNSTTTSTQSTTLDSKLKEEAKQSVPSCARTGPATSFIILFMGHSGSTAIISALQQHSSIAVSGYEPLDHGTLEGNTTAALKYADEYFTNSSSIGKIGGFKLRPHHLLNEPQNWSALFRKHNTRIIWNYRANIFKQAVGHYPIRFLNDSSRYEGMALNAEESRDRVTRFQIHDMAALRKLLDDRYKGEVHVELALMRTAAGRCVLPLSYESFLKDSRRVILRMQAFLGVSMDERLVAMRKKATKDNLCEVVDNWQQVCNAFYGCHRWRAMMEDFDNGCSCRELIIQTNSDWHTHC